MLVCARVFFLFLFFLANAVSMLPSFSEFAEPFTVVEHLLVFIGIGVYADAGRWWRLLWVGPDFELKLGYS